MASPLVGLCMLVLMVGTMLIVLWVQWKFESVVRLWGLALQCIGMGTVLFDLLDRGKSYQRSHPVAWFASWLNRWPRKGDAIELSTEIRMEMTGSAEVRIGLRKVQSGATIEDRVAVIETNLIGLDERVETSRRALQKETRAISDRLREEQDARLANDASIAARLEKSMVGGLHISWFGVIWLFVGAVLSTASQEINALVNAIR